MQFVVLQNLKIIIILTVTQFFMYYNIIERF